MQTYYSIGNTHCGDVELMDKIVDIN